MKKTNNEELRLQIACVDYLRIKNIFYAKFDNEGKRSVISGALAKRAGLRAGIPDIAVFLYNTTLFFEFKSKTGKLSSNQKETHQTLNNLGFKVFIVDDIDKFIKILSQLSF